MLTPIDESILQCNPKFAALYADLKSNILDPAGSTKKYPSQEERDAVSKALKAARVRAAKMHFLRTSLSSLEVAPPTSSLIKQASKPQQNPLPGELIQTILLLSARFSVPDLSCSSVTLLESTIQWAAICEYLPTIGFLISSHLQNQALALARIQSPTTNASFLHRGIPKLVENTKTLQNEVNSKELGVATRRIALVGKTTTLLSIYHLAVTLVIKILEQTKHGSLSRYAKTKAEYLSANAKQVVLETKEKSIRGEKMLYTPEVAAALRNYMVNLKDGQKRLEERERGGRRQLWGYGVGRGDGRDKEKTMKEIARVYGELIKECREVGRDVERLRGQ